MAYDGLRRSGVWTLCFEIRAVVSRRELFTALQPYLSLVVVTNAMMTGTAMMNDCNLATCSRSLDFPGFGGWSGFRKERPAQKRGEANTFQNELGS